MSRTLLSAPIVTSNRKQRAGGENVSSCTTMRLPEGVPKPAVIVLCLSGRGDKDLETYLARLTP